MRIRSVALVIAGTCLGFASFCQPIREVCTFEVGEVSIDYPCLDQIVENLTAVNLDGGG